MSDITNEISKENNTRRQMADVMQWAVKAAAEGYIFSIHNRTSNGDWYTSLERAGHEMVEDWGDNELAARLALMDACEEKYGGQQWQRLHFPDEPDTLPSYIKTTARGDMNRVDIMALSERVAIIETSLVPLWEERYGKKWPGVR